MALPARIAAQTKAPVVACVDEFQAVAKLTDIANFDAVLRSTWQHHQGVCYCLYGSKRHVMLNLFGAYGSPFYQFGDAHVLEKIGRLHWVAYIVHRFQRFGKAISSEDADRLAAYVDDHSYYVQSLAQLTFGLSGKTCSTAVVDAAYEKLLGQLEPSFSQQIAGLSRTQLGFLHALLDGHQAYNGRDILDAYHLGSSANASKLKRVMQEKELVQLSRGGELEFVDPLPQPKSRPMLDNEFPYRPYRAAAPVIDASEAYSTGRQSGHALAAAQEPHVQAAGRFGGS